MVLDCLLCREEYRKIMNMSSEAHSISLSAIGVHAHVDLAQETPNIFNTALAGILHL
jgi:hypothetical protein